MPLLKDILYGVAIRQLSGLTALEVNQIQIDSRKVQAGDCFVAIKGTANDGHAFIDKCIEQGATSIVCEVLPFELKEKVTYVKVENSSKSLGLMAGNFYGNPSIGIKAYWHYRH